MRVEKREEKGEKMTANRKEREQGRKWREKEEEEGVEEDEWGRNEKKMRWI